MFQFATVLSHGYHGYASDASEPEAAPQIDRTPGAGSPNGAAACLSPCGRHLAIMPHPERSVLPWQLPGEMPCGWLKLFANAGDWCDRGCGIGVNWLENSVGWGTTGWQEEQHSHVTALSLVGRVSPEHRLLAITGRHARCDATPRRVPRLAVLISGSGRSLQNLLDRIQDGRLKASVACVVSSKAGVAGLDKAKAAGVPTHVVASKDFKKDWAAMGKAVTQDRLRDPFGSTSMSCSSYYVPFFSIIFAIT